MKLGRPGHIHYGWCLTHTHPHTYVVKIHYILRQKVRKRYSYQCAHDLCCSNVCTWARQHPPNVYPLCTYHIMNAPRPSFFDFPLPVQLKCARRWGEPRLYPLCKNNKLPRVEFEPITCTVFRGHVMPYGLAKVCPRYVYNWVT